MESLLGRTVEIRTRSRTSESCTTILRISIPSSYWSFIFCSKGKCINEKHAHENPSGLELSVPPCIKWRWPLDLTGYSTFVSGTP